MIRITLADDHLVARMGVSVHVDNNEGVATFHCSPTTSVGGSSWIEATGSQLIRLSFHDEEGSSVSISGTAEGLRRWLTDLQSALEYTLNEATKP